MTLLLLAIILVLFAGIILTIVIERAPASCIDDSDWLDKQCMMHRYP